MRNVISCSRRTDIPMHYYAWLQETLKNGFVELKNYYSGEMYTVDLTPETVHSIVLWSKDYGQLIENPGELEKFNLYFQFTITGFSNAFEPGIRPLNETLEQLKRLADKYSPEQINWRFDPIIINNGIGENYTAKDAFSVRLEMFDRIAKVAESSGLKRCTFSFLDFYKKVEEVLEKKNIKVVPLDNAMHDGDVIYKLSDGLQTVFAEMLVKHADSYGIELYACTQPSLQNVKGVYKSQCIDGELLGELFGDKASLAKDQSQRKACGCTKSIDIGSYKQPCPNKCIYCYANPTSFTVE